ncbi:hypothetical protein B0H17DRAFT_1141242 [Mycena rosella]|uniref:DUF6699 domain-containing protein n=1 Tax=Mycena rosella TaxID=1033263 RepID=A0AAD7D3T7_MYCRO|nr:hypothetical protein B0H17DRAFT_1141242 [Mycena rosella]
MNIFSSSPRQKRSRRSSRIPFNSWNFNSTPPCNGWQLSSYSSPLNLPWNYHHLPAVSSSALPQSPWGTSSHSPSHGWGNSWYPQQSFSTPPSPFSTPQLPWATPLPPVQPWYSPMLAHPGNSPYQPMPKWDISTPPATAFPLHALHGGNHGLNLTAAAPETIEKIRIYIETPVISYWTKQWGYATAYKRGGRGITLQDILEAIYNYFQEPLAVDVLPLQYQSMLTAAYTERVAKAGGAYGGLARVDVLNGFRFLSGMRQLSYGDASGTVYIALTLEARA